MHYVCIHTHSVLYTHMKKGVYLVDEQRESREQKLFCWNKKNAHGSILWTVKESHLIIDL